MKVRMRQTRWLFTSMLVVVCSTSAAAPLQMPSSQLIDAPVYGMLRPQAAYEVIDLWASLFTSTAYGKAVYFRLLSKLKRELKFDPTSLKGLQQIGVDAAAIAWGAFGAFDSRRIEATHRGIARTIKKKDAKGSNAKGKPATKAGVPPTFVRSRIVVPLSDTARFKAYLGKLFAVLKPADRTAIAGQVSRHVDGAAAKKLLVDALVSQRVLVFERLDRDAMFFVRVDGNRALLDLVNGWWDLPSKLNAEAIKRGVAALGAPALSAASASSALYRQAFAARPTPGAALYAKAKPLLRLATLTEKRNVLVLQRLAARSSGSGASYWKMSLSRAKRCQQAWKKARWMSGDVALRATLNKRSWHAKAWWGIPRRLLRLVKAGVLSEGELIDPTAYKATIALGGSNLNLGKVAGKLARGVFGKRVNPFLRQMAEPCAALSVSTLATGGWVGLLGVFLTEARAEMLSPVLGQMRNGVALLRSLPKTRKFGRFQVKRPGSAMAHFVFGNGNQVKAYVTSKAGNTPPHTITINKRKTMLFNASRYWQNMALGVTEMKSKQVGLTLGATPNDVRWFVSQKQPDGAIFPPSILAFGHVNLPSLLSHFAGTLSGLQSRMMGPMLKAVADKVGNLKGNISLDNNALAAEARLDRK